MPKQSQVNTDSMVRMYCDQHLTCAEIGLLVGMSRVGVWKRLQTAGVKAQEGERVVFKCDQCGESCWRHRRYWRSHRRRFCSEKCYFKALHNPDYNPNRQGQRMARKVVSQHFQLESKHVVHHEDSDTTHNEIGNLWVFRTQADHMAYERGSEVEPIWKGSKSES